MSRQVRFTDLFGMPERSNIFSDAADLLDDFYGSNNVPAFRVAIRATHAGYLLNNRVYPGKGVKAGAPSWVSKDNGGNAGYDKPFLKHHDSKSEPIGRIDAQKFVQLWDDDKFANDWKHPDHGTSMGSGYILIGGTISDKDAQQKILDGRYKTVSSGQSSNKAQCSICGHDWLNDAEKEEEVCNHRPGSVYDVDGIKYRAYLVTGKMKYLECSFVNHPANELAGILSADFDSSLVPESKEENVQVVTADAMGGVCSIALTDSNGRVTELIKSEDEKDELPYGLDNVKRSVRISVPETFKEAKEKQPLNEGFDLDMIAKSLEGDFDKDKSLIEKRLSFNKALIKHVTADQTKEIIENYFKNAFLNKSQNGKESEEAMSDQIQNKEPEVVADNTQQVESSENFDKTFKILETALADSQVRTAELEAELAKAKQLYDTKIGEYNALMDQNAVLNEEFKKQLSSQLVTMQLQLQKPHVKSIKDSDTFADAVEKVTTRSIESLRDSIEDLVPELAGSFKSKGLPSFVKDRAEEKPPVVRSTKEENVINRKQEQIDPMDQI